MAAALLPAPRHCSEDVRLTHAPIAYEEKEGRSVRPVTLQDALSLCSKAFGLKQRSAPVVFRIYVPSANQWS